MIRTEKRQKSIGNGWHLLNKVLYRKDESAVAERVKAVHVFDDGYYVLQYEDEKNVISILRPSRAMISPCLV